MENDCSPKVMMRGWDYVNRHIHTHEREKEDKDRDRGPTDDGRTRN